MIPKEKAIELVLKFKQRTHYVEVWHTPQLLDKFHHNGISCALIAVDEIIKEGIRWQYWYEVKQEIEKL